MKTIRNVALMAVAAFVAWGCEVEKTQEGEMPEVDVRGGQLPEYDVDAPDVDVGTREERVTVPDVDVDVTKKERTIRVPDVDVNPPGED